MSIHVSDFGPIQELYEAAKALVKNGRGKHRLDRAVTALADMAQAWDETIGEQAMDLYDGPEVQLGNYMYHNETDGYWVEAWLFVPAPLSGEEQEGR